MTNSLNKTDRESEIKRGREIWIIITKQFDDKGWKENERNNRKTLSNFLPLHYWHIQ